MNDTSATKILLRPEEAADRLAIGRTQLFELLRSGELASITVGRLRRIPVAACEEFVARRAITTTDRSGAGDEGLMP